MSMTPLNPKARALIRAGRNAYRPSAADREHVEAALRARLGPDALPLDTAVTQASSAASWPIVAGVAIGIVALGGAGFLALRSTEKPQPRSSAAAPPAAAHAPSTLPDSVPPTEAAAPAPVRVPSPKVATGAAPESRDRLAREVALLSRATSALRAGHAEAALKVLAQHERHFPSGTLREERHAATAQALCLLGRVNEARGELAQLTPGSPAAASAQQACSRDGKALSSPLR
jgi:hypothetical protein